MNPEPPVPSDENLRLTVLGLFAAAGGEMTGIRVGVLNGVAHLAGSLPSLDLYRAAEEMAADVPRVRGVANRIEAPGAPSPSRKIDLDLQPMQFNTTKGDAI
jgi:osmotically-inducible protein OsmY